MRGSIVLFWATVVGLSGLLAYRGCSMHPLSERLAAPGSTGPSVYQHTVHIHAPIDSVWTYVGDSSTAREWSVYFHHISPLDTSRTGQPLPSDGAVGSVRVCHRFADETGPLWDEEVLALDATGPERFRILRTYRLRSFRGATGWLARQTQHYAVQIYRLLNDTTTALTFRTRLAYPDNAFMRWAVDQRAESIQRIFRLNLVNIKAAIEARQDGRPYRRPHPHVAARDPEGL